MEYRFYGYENLRLYRHGFLVFNAQGMVVITVDLKSDTLSNINIDSYLQDGICVGTTTFDSNGTLLDTYTTRQGDEKIIAHLMTDLLFCCENPFQDTKCDFDNEGNLIKVISFSPDGSLIGIREFKYTYP